MVSGVSDACRMTRALSVNGNCPVPSLSISTPCLLYQQQQLHHLLMPFLSATSRYAVPNDVLFIAGLVAYWPACIHDVALLDLYCPHVTSGRLAVCYGQRRSIFSLATAFPTATLRWQQSRYRTVNGKKLQPAIL